MFTRRAAPLAAVVLLLAACGGSPTASAPTPTPSPTPAAPSTLRAAAESRGLTYGCAVGASLLADDAAYAALVTRECGMIVPENDLKWNVLRPSAGSFSFDRADAVVKFAEQNGMRVRGHTLVWHLSMPSWFASVTAQQANAELERHIGTVVGRYAGRIHSWDVVNEAVELADGRADGLRATPWLRLLGPDYIEKAFRAAHAADPNAVLVYNENGLEYAWGAAKRQAVLRLLRDLRGRGVPVHALGIQAHLNARESVDAAGLRAFLAEVAALGMQVVVTEMDVADESLPGDAAVRDQAVAEQYTRLLEVVLAQPATTTVMTWGLSDRYSWLQSYKPRQDGLPVRGLPFDQSLTQKPAYQALARTLAAASVR